VAAVSNLVLVICLDFGAWNLVFIWNLGFSAWDFCWERNGLRAL
jgi:hypothetical protein